jgi:hypothetical protein
MLAVEGPAGDIDPLDNGRCDRLTAVAVMWPRIEPRQTTPDDQIRVTVAAVFHLQQRPYIAIILGRVASRMLKQVLYVDNVAARHGVAPLKEQGSKLCYFYINALRAVAGRTG